MSDVSKLTDSEKLRILAEWFDLRDAANDEIGGEVQTDLRRIADSLTALQAENERLREALTPSADTESAYKGAFRMGLNLRAGNERDYRTVEIPWATIREIMNAIRSRAALTGKDGE